MDAVVHDRFEHLMLDLDRPTAAASSQHSNLTSGVSTAALESSSAKDELYELKIRHVTGERVFWDGNLSLQSEVVYKAKATALSANIGTILGKYLPANYWLTTPSNDSSEEVMIDTNFKPIRLTQPVESLFMSGSKTSTVLLRSRDWYFNDGKASKSSFPKLYDAGASYTTLDDANSVELTIEEVSGRKILWDLKNEKFVSSLGLFFSRNDLSNLRLDSVLGSILARNYIENNAGILEKQFWTDRIKVVGVKDTLDVLFMTSNKSKLYLKYLRNDEEKQWQEIIDAMNAFKQKIAKSDEQIRNYYSEHGILEELDDLKVRIQSEDRNEEEIEDIMRRMEPKLIRALDALKAYEKPEEEPVKEVKSMHRGTSTTKAATQPDKTHAQFYDWW